MRPAFATAAMLAAALCAPSAHAGVYADDFGKCLVRSASEGDQIVLVKWIFSALALHPAVQPMASIDAEQRVNLDQQAAALYQRLIIVDCHKEVVDAVKYEGPSTLEAAFGLLGQVATRGLMTSPEVLRGLQGLDKYIDKSKFEALGREAGISPAAP